MRASLTSEDVDLLEILSFYENVSLHQGPGRYTDFFNAQLEQGDIHPISKLAASDKVASHGGLSCIFSTPWIHTPQSYAEYLDGLAYTIFQLKLPEQTTIGFEVSNRCHAIAFSFQPDTNTWTVMDSNQWPPRSFDLMESVEECAPFIFSGLRGEYARPKYSIGLTTHVVIAGENPLLLKKLEDFHKEFIITKEIARLTGSGDETLLFHAACEGNVSMIEELLEHGADINFAEERGVTPICAAVATGQIEAVEKLLGLGAKLDSVVNYAVHFARLHVIEKLDKLGVDLNLPFNDGASPLFLAAQKGQTEIVRYLLCRNSKLGISNPEGKPFITNADSLRKFAVNRDESIHNRMDELIYAKIKSGESESKISVTPREIAVVMGHDNVISAIDEFETTMKESRKATSEYKKVVSDVRNNAAVDPSAEISTHRNPGK